MYLDSRSPLTLLRVYWLREAAARDGDGSSSSDFRRITLFSFPIISWGDHSHCVLLPVLNTLALLVAKMRGCRLRELLRDSERAEAY